MEIAFVHDRASLMGSPALWRRVLQEQLHAGYLETSDLADVWLVKAVVHLMTACDVPEAVVAECLAGREPMSLGRSSQEPASVTAFVRRLDESRTSVLYAAVATESYLNRCIALYGPSYRSMLDRVPVPERFVLAGMLFSGSDALRPGESLPVGITELFTMRDELARSTPLHAGPAEGIREMFARFNPSLARRMVEVSAHASEALTEPSRPRSHAASRFALEASELLSESAEAASVAPRFTDEELEDAARDDGRFPEDITGD